MVSYTGFMVVPQTLAIRLQKKSYNKKIIFPTFTTNETATIFKNKRIKDTIVEAKCEELIAKANMYA